MLAIAKSHPALVKYAVSIQAKNSRALGFLPRSVFESRVERGQIFLALLDGDPAGYCMTGSGFQGVLRCHQVAVEYDLRRRQHGASLMRAVEDRGIELGSTRVALRCGAELPANQFWESLGYQITGTTKAGSRFSHLNIWEKELDPDWIATEWKNGRPRKYASDAERQAAYRARKVGKVL